MKTKVSSCPGHLGECNAPLHLQISAAGVIVYHNTDVQRFLHSRTGLSGTPISQWLHPRYRALVNKAFPFTQLPTHSTVVARVVTSRGVPHRVRWVIEPVEFASHEQQLLLHGTPLDMGSSSGELPFSEVPATTGEFLPVAETQELAERYPRFLTYLEALVAEHMTGSVFVRTYPDDTVHMTASAYDLLGIAENSPDASDLRIESYLHPEDIFHVLNVSSKKVPPGDVQDLHYRIVTPSGHIRHIKQYVIGTHNPEESGAASFGLCIDETDAVVAERSQRTLIECLEAVTRATSEYELISRIAKTLNTTGGYRYVVFYEPQPPTQDPDAPEFVEVVSHGDSRWLNTNTTPILKGIVEGGGHYSPEVSPASGDPSSEFIPIYTAGKLTLILAVWSDGPSAFTGANALLLPQVAHQIQFALEKLATQRPIAVLVQELSQQLASERALSAEELQSGLHRLLAAIAEAGDSSYWKSYVQWDDTIDWTPPADTDIPRT